MWAWRKNPGPDSPLEAEAIAPLRMRGIVFGVKRERRSFILNPIEALTDFDGSIIQPLLPNKPPGVPRADDRKGLNGVFWRLRTNAPWADIPER